MPMRAESSEAQSPVEPAEVLPSDRARRCSNRSYAGPTAMPAKLEQAGEPEKKEKWPTGCRHRS